MVRLLNLMRFALVLLPYVLILQLVMLGCFANEIQEHAYFLSELSNNLSLESFFIHISVILCLSFVVSFLSNGTTISLNKNNQIAIRKNEKLFRTLYRLNRSLPYLVCFPFLVVILIPATLLNPDNYVSPWKFFIIWLVSLVIVVKIFRVIRNIIDNKLFFMKIKRIINSNNLSSTYWYFEDDTQKYTVVFFPKDYKFACFNIKKLTYGLHDFSIIQNCNVSSMATTVASNNSIHTIPEYIFALDCFNKERDFSFSIVKRYYDRGSANHLYNNIKILLDEYNDIQNGIEPIVEAEWSNVDSETGRININ